MPADPTHSVHPNRLPLLAGLVVDVDAGVPHRRRDRVFVRGIDEVAGVLEGKAGVARPERNQTTELFGEGEGLVG